MAAAKELASSRRASASAESLLSQQLKLLEQVRSGQLRVPDDGRKIEQRIAELRRAVEASATSSLASALQEVTISSTAASVQLRQRALVELPIQSARERHFAKQGIRLRHGTLEPLDPVQRSRQGPADAVMQQAQEIGVHHAMSTANAAVRAAGSVPRMVASITVAESARLRQEQVDRAQEVAEGMPSIGRPPLPPGRLVHAEGNSWTAADGDSDVSDEDGEDDEDDYEDDGEDAEMRTSTPRHS
eukprot:jgi/Chlat1/6865/Chrsp51S06542